MSESGADRPASDEQAFRDEIARLNKIVTALMNRAERSASNQRSDFGMFQTTLMLESQVRERTEALEESLHENEKINRALHNAKAQMEIEMEERKRTLVALEHEQKEQRILIKKLEDAHHQLLQSEKMASIGQLAAGVAHDIGLEPDVVRHDVERGFQSGVQVCPLPVRVLEAREVAQILHDALDTLRSLDRLVDQRWCVFAQEVDVDRAAEFTDSLRQRGIVGHEAVTLFIDGNQFQQGGDVVLERTQVGTDESDRVVDFVRELGDIPAVECLPFQINQVFLNILLNAAQSITGRGTITLRSGRVTDEVWISITDTGQGIPPERMARIFDPFYTTKPVGQGTGLGLSVSYGIVKKHGGRIDVQSQTGAGATFTIRLPIKRPAAA